MKLWHVALALVCLILGAVGLYLYLRVECQPGTRCRVLGLDGGGQGTSHDSPVTARGGSITIAAPKGQFLQLKNSPLWEETSDNNDDAIYLYGVEPDLKINPPPANTPLSPLPNSGNYNWKIQVWDRDQFSHMARSSEVDICSAQPSTNKPCAAPSGVIAPVSNMYDTWFYVPSPLCIQDPATIYDEGAKPRHVVSVHDASDDHDYYCQNPTSHARDHIGYIDVTFAAASGKPQTWTYDCVNGQCMISIGAPEP